MQVVRRRDANRAPTSLTDSLLLTDLYEITMGSVFWKNQLHEREAVFRLYFRRNPFRGGFSVLRGLADAIAYLHSFGSEREAFTR